MKEKYPTQLSKVQKANTNRTHRERERKDAYRVLLSLSEENEILNSRLLYMSANVSVDFSMKRVEAVQNTIHAERLNDDDIRRSIGENEKPFQG